MTHQRLCALVLLAISAVAAPAAAEEITWLVIDYPPFNIPQGKEQGQGVADGVMRLLEARLTRWNHRERLAEPAVIMASMSAGEHVCSVPYIRTPERERVMAFSVPALIAPPLAISIRREALAKFGGGAPVSLERLLADRKLRLAVAVGRSYGPQLDALLQRHREAPNVYWRRGTDVYRGLFDLLVKGSVDYIVGLPEEALYLARERGIEGQIVNVPLIESSDYLVGHVACPNNDWGRHVMAAIDKVLLAERTTNAYRASMERWVDENLKNQFRQHYQTLLLEGH